MSGPRHRRGSPPNPRPQPQPPIDVHQRQQAALIDAREPGWVVVYAPWRRMFTAFAAWPTPQGVVVDSATPDELWEAMRGAEAEHGAAFAPAWGRDEKADESSMFSRAVAPAWGRDGQIRQAGWDRPWR